MEEFFYFIVISSTTAYIVEPYLEVEIEMPDFKQIAGDFVHLARLALTGRAQDVQLLVHRAAKRYRAELPDMAESLAALLHEAPTRASPLRRVSDVPLPVDTNFRLHLLRVESNFDFDHELVLAADIEQRLRQIVAERTDPKAPP